MGVSIRSGGPSRWKWRSVAALAVPMLLVAAVPAASGEAAVEYTSLPASARIADTRAGAKTVDGLFAGIGLRAAGSTTEVPISGRAGVPVGTPFVVLTVTAVDPLADGFVTVHATGTARPNASNLNFYTAHNTPGTVIAPVGTDGKVSVFTSAATHLIIDVAGFLPAGGAELLAAGARLADTRPGASTIDGLVAGVGLRAAESTLDVPVTGRAGVHSSGVVILTVAAVDPLAAGFLTVHATGGSRPIASNVNFYAGHNAANLVIGPLGTDGKVSIFTSAPTHLIVDVAGLLPAGTYTPLPSSARLADSRPGATTVDHLFVGGGRIAGGASMQLDVAGRAGVPVDASAAVLTVTAVDPVGTGFSTVHPTGTARPNASNLNWYPDHNTANTVIARIGAGGQVCIFASSATHFVVDVSGYLSGPAPDPAGPACPPPPPLPAIWPAANILFATPEEAATDFVSKRFPVPNPRFGPFQQGDSRSGEMAVLHPGDDADPTTFFPSGTTLLLRRLGADDGWFVTAAVSDEVSISTHREFSVVGLRPVTVGGLAAGHERTVFATAFVAGSTTSLDTEITMAGLFAPEPYSVTLDLSGAKSDDVIALLVQGDSGLHTLAGQFAAVPVLAVEGF